MSDVPAVLGVMAYGRAAARLGRASRAAVLSKEGASPRRILLETGYQRGPYGWGVETRGDVYLKPASVFGARPSGTLEEMADVHPDVERAYPGIGRELRVEVVPDNAWADRVAAARKSLALWASHGDTASGFYDRGNHLIAVRAQMPGETMNGYIDRADGTVTHEVQHYAQERDGLRPGGPRRHVDADDYREDGIEVEARNSAARRKLTPEERREMPRLMTQDVKPEDVRRDDKGGDNFGTFRNFLATDDVPETIFGFPVVQDESQYTEKDLEFFRKNPKAAGFYDLGDEEADEDTPPVMDLFGGDTEAYREAFAQKRKDLVNSTAERQYKALLKFKDPDHRRRVEGYLYAALDSDARNATLLDEYNRLAEANRPRGRRGQALYDEMVERGRGRFAGGAWEKALGELISPDWVPPAEAPVAQARQGQSFVSRAKEALNVAKELPGLITGGAERYAANVIETVSAAGAVLAAPEVPGVEVYDPISGAIRDGKTGRIKRMATDRDRADIHEVNKAIGVRQALGAGNTRGAYPGSLNNPGNVEKRRERRQGEVESPHRRWAKFATPQDGLREMADVIRQIAEVKLAEKGLPFTIRNFAGVYAPGTENDTAKYVADISADSGFGPDEELHRFDGGDMARLLRSVVKFESGAPHSAWFTDEEYAEAAKKLQEGAVD